MVRIGNKWDELLKEEFNKEYYRNLRAFLIDEYKNHKVYPNPYDIYNALRLTDFDDVKVVILGQDPYHQEGQAHGLAFSVKEGVKIPPSLVNIYKELSEDLGQPIRKSGCLKDWAEQGVLLLNTVLTVRDSMPNSHRDKGWEILTDKIIEFLNNREERVIFILWGSPSRKKKRLINKPQHIIIEGVHPSPLSAYRGFFGGKYFSKINEILGEKKIKW